VHEIPPGECIEVATQTVLRGHASGTIDGRPFDCSGRCVGSGFGAFVLEPGGGYRRLPGGGRCESNPAIVLPGEVGRVRARRGGRLVLAPDNLRDIRAAALACVGRRVRGMRTRLRPSRSGWRGISTLRYTVSDDLTIAVRGTTRINGVSAPSADPPDVPDVPGRRMPPCRDGLRLVCRLTD
jgi:hypothetical protein